MHVVKGDAQFDSLFSIAIVYQLLHTSSELEAVIIYKELCINM